MKIVKFKMVKKLQILTPEAYFLLVIVIVAQSHS